MRNVTTETKRFVKKHSSTILSCLGAVGVVATTVTAVKATPKAIELIKADSRKNHDGDPYAYTKLEAFRSAWKCYIPAGLVGASTIICIFGANMLNKRNQAALISAYSLLDSSFKEYREHTELVYGEDANQKVIESIANDKYSKLPIAPAEDKQLFYDMFSRRYFECTLTDAYRAEYTLNRDYAEYGYASINDLYDLLGIPRIDCGDDLGWSVEASEAFYGYSSIEFEHELILIDDGEGGNLECYVLIMPFIPTADYMC